MAPARLPSEPAAGIEVLSAKTAADCHTLQSRTSARMIDHGLSARRQNTFDFSTLLSHIPARVVRSAKRSGPCFQTCQFALSFPKFVIGEDGHVLGATPYLVGMPILADLGSGTRAFAAFDSAALRYPDRNLRFTHANRQESGHFDTPKRTIPAGSSTFCDLPNLIDT